MLAGKVLLPSAMHPLSAACKVNAYTSSGSLQILAGSVPVPPAMHSFHAALNRIFEKGRDPEKQKSWYLRVSFLSAAKMSCIHKCEFEQGRRLHLVGCLACWCVLLGRVCGCEAGITLVKGGWLCKTQRLDFCVTASQDAESYNADCCVRGRAAMCNNRQIDDCNACVCAGPSQHHLIFVTNNPPPAIYQLSVVLTPLCL